MNDLHDYRFQPDLALATTLPARWYSDPAVFAQERDKVFHGTWQLVGRAASLAAEGDYFTCELLGEPLVLVRGADRMRAFYNVCRHRAGPVALGMGNRRSLSCRYHGWTYGLDGKLLAAPEMDGVGCFAPEQVRLCEVALAEWAGFLFVNLSRDPAPSLAETLGPVVAETAALPLGGNLGQLRCYKRIDYELRCNWKVYVDNYLEGYHLPVVHPGLFRELDYRAYRVETGRHHSKQHAPIRPTEGSLYQRNLPQGADPLAALALYYWIFPNLMLNVYPDNLQINLILPLSPERTLTRFEWYVPDPDRPGRAEEFADSLAFSDLVQQEDIAICEAVQRGLGSRSYDRGRFSALRENGVHHFHGLLCERLGASAAGGQWSQ